MTFLFLCIIFDCSLLFYYFQYIHRTGFCTDTACDTFGCRIALCLDDQSKRTGFCTGSATGTFLFVDHVNAFCILSDRTFRTGFCTFATLWTGHRAYTLLLYDLDTGLVRMKLLIKASEHASTHARQAIQVLPFFTFSFFMLILRIYVFFFILPFSTKFLNRDFIF